MVYESILSVDIEQVDNNEIKIKEMDINNLQMTLKCIELTSKGFKVVESEKGYTFEFERNKLYEALVVRGKTGNLYYKKIVNLVQNNKFEKEFDNYLLPIGTVVKLDNNENYLIISRGVETENKYSDYVGCDNYLGLEENVQMFSHSEIKQLLSVPYEDEKTVISTLKIKQIIDERRI